MSARSPIAIYGAFIFLKETFSADREERIIDIILTSPRRESCDEISQETKYLLLTISFSSDSTTCTCNFGLYQMWKGLGKIFHPFARHSYTVLQRKSLLRMLQVSDFDRERFMIKVEILAGWKNIFHVSQVVTFDVTVHQRTKVFSEIPNTLFISLLPKTY